MGRRMQRTAGRRAALAVIGCLLALAACGGPSADPPATCGVATGTAGRGAVGPSTASFTLSGALSRSVTLSVSPADGQGALIATQSACLHTFFFNMNQDDGQGLQLGVTTFAGPGAYTVRSAVNQSEGVTVIVLVAGGVAGWDLASGACQLTIASVRLVPGVTNSVSGDGVPVNNVSEARGSFTCPALAPDDAAAGTQPVAVTAGQFDVFLDGQ